MMYNIIILNFNISTSDSSFSYFTSTFHFLNFIPSSLIFIDYRVIFI